MDRRRFIASGAAGAAVATVAAPHVANAQPRVRWRCPGSFPKSLDTLYGTQEHICRRVSEITDGAFQIQPFAAGELVPALQVLDAVGTGSVEIGYSAPYYYNGKDPSLAFGSVVPFGLNARQQYSWWHNGGGAELMAPVFRDQGVHNIMAGNTGAQMGGWFRKEIRSVEDLRGLKFRIAGYAGDVLGKLGAVAQQLGGSDIYPALERGVIDGAEWVGPYDDEKLGFQRVAQYYYYPGWWEPSASLSMMVNLRAWEGLPAHFKAALETACHEGINYMMGRYDAQNPPALRRLIAAGTQLRPFPRDVIAACYRATQELFAELGARNARFKEIHTQWDAFRRDQQTWFRVVEDSYSNSVAQVQAQQR